MGNEKGEQLAEKVSPETVLISALSGRAKEPSVMLARLSTGTAEHGVLGTIPLPELESQPTPNPTLLPPVSAAHPGTARQSNTPLSAGSSG